MKKILSVILLSALSINAYAQVCTGPTSPGCPKGDFKITQQYSCSDGIEINQVGTINLDNDTGTWTSTHVGTYHNRIPTVDATQQPIEQSPMTTYVASCNGTWTKPVRNGLFQTTLCTVTDQATYSFDIESPRANNLPYDITKFDFQTIFNPQDHTHALVYFDPDEPQIIGGVTRYCMGTGQMTKHKDGNTFALPTVAQIDPAPPEPEPGDITNNTPIIGVNENGQNNIQVQLSRPPTAPVSIALQLADTTRATADAEILIPAGITIGNANIVGIDDALVNGDLTTTLITMSAISDDLGFHGDDVEDSQVNIIDDEVAIDPTTTGEYLYNTETFENGTPVTCADAGCHGTPASPGPFEAVFPVFDKAALCTKYGTTAGVITKIADTMPVGFTANQTFASDNCGTDCATTIFSYMLENFYGGNTTDCEGGALPLASP
ncbi:MAG: hypothetical protein ACR2PR_06580 [Pseudohongiellaceae bacterium]